MKILIVGNLGSLDRVTICGIVSDAVEEEVGKREENAPPLKVRFDKESDVFVAEDGLTARGAHKKIAVFILPSFFESSGKKKAVENIAAALKKELHECEVILARKFPS